ncbi:carbon-nitrogen hydrolase family protein [Alkalicaulis satelles]|uniref:Carbon-nitrogen hydrolase family protein n=1 Tax=Alkalicaulis satelles TaxID=2609175 RepID=A0A5M6ZCP7_9PROT|nr:nitrilase-related carbon-nitrogen hydrolase [Alkalicaulis satelles]KAA5801674.1 carbon-nitrogen hydrolase family protein [Alkalicaulis satelles]
MAAARSILIALAFVTGLWGVWRLAPLHPSPAPAAITLEQQGAPSGRALIAIEPSLSAHDYRSAQALEAALSAYLDSAHDAGALEGAAIAVFPEHAGTWLAAANAQSGVYRAQTLDGAMAALALSRPVGTLTSVIASPEPERAAAGLFRARGPAMARDYQAVFSALARRYGVTIVAGSIVLPDPRVENGQLSVNRAGPLYNVTAVFAPDGSLHRELVRKVYPIPSEAGFTASAPPALPIFDTPAGALGVLICADSWHPDVYAGLAGAPDLIAVPAFLQPTGVWDAPWGGYVTPWPDDAPRRDAGRLTEAEAWIAHSLPRRLADTSAQLGVTAFARGAPWDLGADGQTLIATPHSHQLGPRTPGGAVVVAWVGE